MAPCAEGRFLYFSEEPCEPQGPHHPTASQVARSVAFPFRRPVG